MFSRTRACARVGTLLVPLLLLSFLVLPTTTDAQQIVRLPVGYHSQIPPNDPNIPANWPWAEPGNAPIPNGYCTCACLDMLFNYATGGLCPHANPPLPQQEFAAVANTNDCMGGGTYSGTYLTDARRAVHFSPRSPAWPCNPPNYINPNKTGYSWPSAWPIPGPTTKYGMVGIEGNWTANGWNMAQFKQTLALGIPIMVNVNAGCVGDSLPELDLEDSDTERTGYNSVENTVSGHSIIVRGYHNPMGTFLIHDPTLGPALMINQNTFWNYWWQSKEFLIVVPWSTTVNVPALGSFVPQGFQVTATAAYTDPLPVTGTGVNVQTQGKLSFFPAAAGTLNSALAQGQPQTINFNQVVTSGQSQQRPWQCVTRAYSSYTLAAAETWGRVNAVAHSFPGGYTDDIGSIARGSVRVPRPQVGDVCMCRIPRWCWWRGDHVSAVPHLYTPGLPNDFVVEVRNQGELPVTDVVVELFYGDPAALQWASSPTLIPMGGTTIPIIDPGGSVMTSPVTFIPPTANSFWQRYYDFFVVAHCGDDPPMEEWVEVESNMTCESEHWLEIDPYMGTWLEFWAGNPFGEECAVAIKMDTYLPPDWSAQLAPAGMDSILMAPGEMQSRTILLDVGSENTGMVEVYEDVYDLENNFVRRTGGASFLVWTTGTGVPHGEAVTDVRFAPPAPNPTAGVTELSFTVPEPAVVELSIYDLSGRLVATLHRGWTAAGRTRLSWDARDDGGERVGSGVYFARLTANGDMLERKIVVVR